MTQQETIKTDLDHATMTLNIGPAHPATHGALRTQVELSGETIVKAASEIGYLHRGFEKHTEQATYQQVIPYTDRLNYCSALMNNVGYCKAVEELLDIKVPDRAIIIRVIICELSRIIDHLICVCANLVDLGALTNFWYFFNKREKVYNIIEKIAGSRLTCSYTRIGGLARDLYPGFENDLKNVLKEIVVAVKDVTGLVQNNRIFVDRTVNVGCVTQEQALDWGFTGPCLRATGVEHDLRKAEPYYYYDEFDFDIPIAENGDTYDRIMIRIEEIRQSTRIILQALDKLPAGPIKTNDARIAMPDKNKVYGSIEGLMNQFKLIVHGIKPPPGEIYSATEAANGELGFYIISDGSMNPYRIKVRPPCFPLYAAFERIIEGGMIADAVAVLGSINIIAGEIDR